MTTSRPRVIVTRRLPLAVERRLAESYDVRLNEFDRALSPDELRDAAASTDALVPCVSDRIPSGVIEAGRTRLRIIANFGAGTDHIALDTAGQLTIAVTNTPGVLTEDTADLTMALLLATARRTGEGEREVRAGQWTGWRPTHLLGTSVHGKTLGIVGFGRIGQAVAKRARDGFGMRILVHTRRPGSSTNGVAHSESVEALLAASDFISLHCPSSPETRHLISAYRLSLMQPHAILINTSRGEVVDEAALVTALERGAIRGAGLDVYEHEPRIHAGLVARDDVVLLPHLGSATLQARTAMGMMAADNLDAFFAGRQPPDQVR